MSIKTITTTLALSFLTAVSFADEHSPKINMGDLNEILVKYEVFEKNPHLIMNAFECIKAEEVHDGFLSGYKKNIKKPIPYVLDQSQNIEEKFIQLVLKIYEKYKAVPLDIVMLFPNDTIKSGSNLLKSHEIFLMDPQWLKDQKSLKTFFDGDQLVIDKNMCILGMDTRSYGTLTEMDEGKIHEFLGKFQQ